MTDSLHDKGAPMVYLGFDVNGEECERYLGDSFETHIPSRNEIVYRAGGLEVSASVGDALRRDPEGGTE